MTRPRYDTHSTEFGLWLRRQSDLASNLGFVATNLDYMWRNFKTNEWLLLEEKRFLSAPPIWQRRSFEIMHRQACDDQFYRGFHLLQFEQTSPEDGSCFLNGEMIDGDSLIAFLRFEAHEQLYVPWFPRCRVARNVAPTNGTVYLIRSRR